jgi:hypothetical protein
LLDGFTPSLTYKNARALPSDTVIYLTFFHTTLI